jgi:Zn-dependent protease with chaperone function
MGLVHATAHTETYSDPAELDEAVHAVLRLPSGTTLRTSLLATMVALSAVYVGQWAYISATVNPQTDTGPPLPWLALPPAATLTVALVATWLAPRWLELRRGWRRVPPDRGAAALARFDDLVVEARLRTKPVLVWNPTQEHDRALAYGRPGAYRVALSPTMLSAARRRPTVFDAVVRHELAHLRHGDVALAYFVIILWYVFLALLIGSFLLLELTFGAYLTPDLLVRGAILALTVYWVRANVLRRRERYADLRAADTLGHRAALTSTLALRPAVTARRRRFRFALHPAAEERVAALADPRQLGRVDPVEMFAVGLTATWGTQMLWEFIRATGVRWFAMEAAALILLSAVGAYVGATLVRWTGCSAISRSGGLAGGAAGLFLGLSVGATLSVGRSGLQTHWTSQVGGEALTAAVLAGYYLWSADLSGQLNTSLAEARSRRRSTAATILASAVVFGLAAASMSRVSIFLIGGQTQALDRSYIFTMGRGLTTVLTAITSAIGLCVLLRGRQNQWRDRRNTLATGLGFAIVGTSTIALIRERVDVTTDARLVLGEYFLLTLWTSAGTAVLAAALIAASGGAGRLTAGVTAGVITAAGMALGDLLVENLLHEGHLEASALGSVRYTGGAVVLIAPVVAGVLWLAGDALGHRHHSPRVHATITILAIVTAIAVPVTVAPPVINQAPQRAQQAEAAARSELRSYLQGQVQSIAERRSAAIKQLQGTVALPPAEAVDRIQQSIEPRYRQMLADLEDDDLEHPPARKVRDDLHATVSAEQDLIWMRVNVLEGRADQRTYAQVAAELDEAIATWQATWQAAMEQAEQ